MTIYPRHLLCGSSQPNTTWECETHKSSFLLPSPLSAEPALRQRPWLASSCSGLRHVLTNDRATEIMPCR